jgi:hypothetical protein
LSEGEIALERGETKGRYVLRQNGAEAELTFSIVNAGTIIADHTGVPDAMRGTGAGLRLVERLVADARAGGIKVIALCPFVRAQARRHPEWADVFA